MDTNSPSPSEAWATMLEGNGRFVANAPEHPNQDAARRATLADGQAPFAQVFGCADSRVAAEMIFDRGIGDLFVTRTAGQVLDSAVLGTLEFGVHVLGTPLLVVLGHDSCGAVGAGLEAHATGALPPGHLSDVVQKVTPSVLTAHREGVTDPRGVMERHVAATVDLIPERSRLVGERLADGSLGIVGAAYDLANGTVRVVHQLGL
ncbi:carbonic anhydrase [Kytococcus sp. Marseille-QA3725]